MFDCLTDFTDIVCVNNRRRSSAIHLQHLRILIPIKKFVNAKLECKNLLCKITIATLKNIIYGLFI